jgi:hypothetical protein
MMLLCRSAARSGAAAPRYLRKTPVDQLKVRRQLLDRVIAERAPELHILGEIVGGTGFGSAVSCRYSAP